MLSPQRLLTHRQMPVTQFPMSKTALVILAEGFEEIEAITPIDILQRAGVKVTVASLGENLAQDGKHGIRVHADALLQTALENTYDLVVLPGGPGHKHLRSDKRVLELIRKQVAEDRLLGAICAAPTVLKEADILPSRYTAHFSVADELTEIVEDASVVEEGYVITSRGAGTAVEFALALVSRLCGGELACKIAGDICYRPGIAHANS